jgi:CRP/FNR family cyclic AMP-dependent transcriptional regulator
LLQVIERILLLKRVPFFESLRTDQLRYIAPILEPVVWIRGEHVVLKGDPADTLYIIVSGRIGISLPDDPNSDDFVATLQDGDCFGEMGVLDDLPRSATAHALQDTEALALGKDKLHGLLLSYPELGVGMLRAMSRRLRQADAALLGGKGLAE